MTTLEEVRKSIEAVIGNLTPAKAQELAKSLSDPGPRRSRCRSSRPTCSCGRSGAASV
jgi:hypothetical protein